MRALILAAGGGKRSGQSGERLPDYLTPFGGKPLIIRQIAALHGGGVTEIAVVRAPQAAKIDVPDITCFVHERGAEIGTVMALTAATAWLRSGPVIVSDANIFYPHDLVHRLGSVRGNLVLAYDRTMARSLGSALRRSAGTSRNISPQRVRQPA